MTAYDALTRAAEIAENDVRYGIGRNIAIRILALRDSLAVQNDTQRSEIDALKLDLETCNKMYEGLLETVRQQADEIVRLSALSETAKQPCNMDVIVSHERHEHLLACERAANGGTAKVPEGWKLVPVEPSKDMLEAVSSPEFQMFSHGQIQDVYQRMLAFVPSTDKRSERTE